MNPLNIEYQIEQEVTTPKFDTEHVINLRSLSVHLLDIMAQDLNRLHLCGQGHIREQDSQMLKRDYLGREGNYKFYLGTFQGLSGFHQVDNTNTPAPKEFQ
jgi:hypothetical protein